ncbi:ABC transporter permease [Zhihengliuella flava]|uniref:ABC-type nitrate/sulfonate/bicarbonate transport system permease component n=1 Tax=Zhihengliuella flava TaxID=1285193 RepID=A0A931GLF8_9MICC|nr:ABC transporter permease subunit [Zhihengliuella flava]MBG6084409.1 ABC-type nitrate/sulfonate/bicarbonate transport system permease component [Zhihengliuella flava]
MTTSSTTHRNAPARRIDVETPAAQAVLGAAGALILLGAWQLAAASGAFGTGLPTVTDTLGALVSLFGTEEFWVQTGITVASAAAGLALAVVGGVILGVLIGMFEPVWAATLAITEFLKPIPPIVILPLAVMVFGPTSQMALFLVVAGCLLTVSIQAIAGVRDADPVALATARSYGMGGPETLWRVVLPSATAFIGTAVRVSAPASLIIVVVAGLLGGAPGLGRSIYQAQAGGLYPTLYALVLVLGILGVASQWASSAVERRVLHWHPSFRKETP